MKIKIIKEIPVKSYCRPCVGQIYDVVDIQGEYPYLYYIIVNGTKVGIYLREMDVVEE